MYFVLQKHWKIKEYGTKNIFFYIYTKTKIELNGNWWLYCNVHTKLALAATQPQFLINIPQQSSPYACCRNFFFSKELSNVCGKKHLFIGVQCLELALHKGCTVVWFCQSQTLFVVFSFYSCMYSKAIIRISRVHLVHSKYDALKIRRGMEGWYAEVCVCSYLRNNWLMLRLLAQEADDVPRLIYAAMLERLKNVPHFKVASQLHVRVSLFWTLQNHTFEFTKQQSQLNHCQNVMETANCWFHS